MASDKAEYEVQVTTGNFFGAGTFDKVYITLTGKKGDKIIKIPRTRVSFSESVTVHADEDLGDLLMITLEKEARFILPESGWYCEYVKVSNVKTGKEYVFAVFTWVLRNKPVSVIESSARKSFEGTKELEELQAQQQLRQGVVQEIHEGSLEALQNINLGLISGPAPEKVVRDLHEEMEFVDLKKVFDYMNYLEGIPKSINISSASGLPKTLQLSFKKVVGLGSAVVYTTSLETMKKIRNLGRTWTRLDDFERIFWHPSPVADYIYRHWKTDELFAMLFLNGCNPILIKRCTELPQAFSALKDEKLDSGNSLSAEIENKKAYVADYSILEGIKPNVLDGQQQHVAAPICILYEDPTKGLTPVAIKIGRAPDDLVFRPKDGLAWLLAKVWVRNSEFYVHELSSHLLRTHFLAEVFAIAGYRCLSYTHPVGKIMFPHGRYTLPININARTALLSKNGFTDNYTGVGGGGHYDILVKAFKLVTYESLCLPDELENRGVKDLKNYYYKEDGMLLWNAVSEFVSNFVDLFYKNDDEVKKDSNLQDWVKEIFQYGFLNREASGIPSSLESKPAFKKYLTMVLFTCSAQHAAVNNGQFDIYAWVPNSPSTMRKPPPKSTEDVTEEFIMQTLPEINVASRLMALMYLFSYPGDDFVKLGDYPEHTFVEPEMKKHIEQFRTKLKEIDESIKSRNKKLFSLDQLPYNYMEPSQIEASIGI